MLQCEHVNVGSCSRALEGLRDAESGERIHVLFYGAGENDIFKQERAGRYRTIATVRGVCGPC